MNALVGLEAGQWSDSPDVEAIALVVAVKESSSDSDWSKPPNTLKSHLTRYLLGLAEATATDFWVTGLGWTGTTLPSRRVT